jgi:CHAT domain-containing protein
LLTSRLEDPKLLVLGNPEFGPAPITSGDASSYIPLPNSEKECAEVCRLFTTRYGGRVTALQQKDATQAKFRSQIEASDFTFVHLATHGFHGSESSALGRRSEYSESYLAKATGLVFAGANLTDETPTSLTADEIVNLPLSKTEQVVLSACNTSVGEDAKGANEAIYSLRRAFHVAGVESILASAWSVPDHATLAIMRQYYANIWQKRMNKRDALRAAKIWMINHYQPSPEPDQLAVRGEVFKRKVVSSKSSSRRASPYYWGAWTLSGGAN